MLSFIVRLAAFAVGSLVGEMACVRPARYYTRASA